MSSFIGPDPPRRFAGLPATVHDRTGARWTAEERGVLSDVSVRDVLAQAYGRGPIKSSVPGKELLEIPENSEFGTAWAHPRVAEHACLWCGNADVVAALTGYVDDTVPVRAEDPSDADVAIEAVVVDGITTTRRSSDGYVQGSDLGKSIGTKWSNFMQSNKTRTLFEAISKQTGVPVANLVYTGIGVKAGVWVHPKTAIAFVSKCRPQSARVRGGSVRALHGGSGVRARQERGGRRGVDDTRVRRLP